MHRRSQWAAACVGTLFFVFAGLGPALPAGAQTAGGDPADDASIVDDFLALQAGRGKLVEAGSAYKLTLSDVSPHVGVFDDADPSQASSDISVTRLMKSWDDLGLADDPPLAAVSVLDGAGQGTAGAYTLSDPKADGDSVSFTATPVEDAGFDTDVAPALVDSVAAGTGDVPQQFGQAAVLIDPVGSTGLIQYCSATITNQSGTVVVGAVLGALPIFPPTVVIPTGTASYVKTSAPVGCNISIAFTTGARTWSLTMSAVTGKSNTVGASSNVTVVPGNRSSPRWNCTFTLNP